MCFRKRPEHALGNETGIRKTEKKKRVDDFWSLRLLLFFLHFLFLSIELRNKKFKINRNRCPAEIIPVFPLYNRSFFFYRFSHEKNKILIHHLDNIFYPALILMNGTTFLAQKFFIDRQKK